MSGVATRSFASGRYAVERTLGRGGMATVYLARDRELDRPVAIKVLHGRLAADASLARRFRREAQTAAQLAHPNVVSVFDAGEEEGELYIVMEHVEGEGLDSVLRRERRLAPARALALATEAAGALGYAHGRGVVHRDVKPANLLLRSDDVVKVTDFGIARALDATTQLTQAGTLLGTVAYVAPEQARGEPAGPPADVFSLGVVLYETLTGEQPWRIETLAELATVRETPARPVRELAPDVPPPLEAAVMKALARNPRYRPADGRELAAELAGAEPPGAPSDRPTAVLPAAHEPLFSPAAPEPSRPWRRRGRLAALAAVPVAAVTLAAAYAVGGGEAPERPPVEPAPAADNALEQARSFEQWLRDHTAEAP